MGPARTSRMLFGYGLWRLRNDQPPWWDEREVSRFHEIVTELEEAFAVDLSAFAIPDSEMKQRIVAVQRPHARGASGSDADVREAVLRRAICAGAR